MEYPFLTYLLGVGVNSSEMTRLVSISCLLVWKTIEVVDVHKSFAVDVGLKVAIFI